MTELVATTHGPVTGTEKRAMVTFAGIRYAAPPVGELRFRAPQPPESWSEPLEAKAFGNIPPQSRGPLKILFEGQPAPPEDEDCLFLNVYTPKVDKESRPVMVWIHGGAYTNGAGSFTNPSPLVRRGDVVVVTLNYRLGALGFLYLGDTKGGQATSGNNGLLDQIAALKWVQDNISQFGGDPNNVTVFGESAGGMSVAALMTMPDAKGLFHKAINQSGPPGFEMELEEARSLSKQFIEASGSASVQDLQAMSVDKIIECQDRILAGTIRICPFGPLVDGKTLQEPVLKTLATGAVSDVSLLVGSTQDEFNLWSKMIYPSAGFPDPNKEQVQEWAKQIPGFPADGFKIYQSNRPKASHYEIYSAIQTDYSFRIPAIHHAEAQAASQSKTFMYLFSWKSPAVDMGSCHGLELGFLFEWIDKPVGKAWVGEGHIPDRLPHQMQDAWIAFARSGDPNHKGLPTWPSYDVQTRATMEFNESCQIIHDPFSHERKLWESSR